MSYQVLARKWRPQNFAQLVGQDHVKAALTNALTQNRLHHAYLFTGTRGVGKTTIARIFAKSLNCEQGVTATPCGVCSACVEIDKGYFVDLLEIDAASRTKVEDTRDLLDNVQYAPSRGRYKVYLIDEVHMLSKHSFNALLKTLEEPPPHVKFLLATTDPQKLPITVLSRCLQFSLKALSQAQIKQHLSYVLGQEHIAAEDEALALLARAAKGSLRDSLSLTDQAIAQTNGQISLGPVREMLGYLEQSWAELLLQDVLNRDLAQMQQHLLQLIAQHSQFQSVLDDMLSLLHLAALTQFQLSAAELAFTESAFVRAVAKTQSAEAIQLYYQLLLSGKKDLSYAPDQRTGLEMALLRAIAFVPATAQELAAQAEPSSRTAALSAAGIPTPAVLVEPAVAAVVDSGHLAETVADQPQSAQAHEVADVLPPQTTAGFDAVTASIMARRGMAPPAFGATAVSPAVTPAALNSAGLPEKKSERPAAPVTSAGRPVVLDTVALVPATLIPIVETAPVNPHMADQSAQLSASGVAAEMSGAETLASVSSPVSAPAPVSAPVVSPQSLPSSASIELAPPTFQAEVPSNAAILSDEPEEEPDPVAESAGGDWAWQQYQAEEQPTPPGASQPIRHALLDSVLDSSLNRLLGMAPAEQQNTDFSADIAGHAAQKIAAVAQPLVFTGVIDQHNFAVRSASQIDTWAACIDQLTVGGLMRLFLLHSAMEQDEQILRLTVLQSQRHLDNDRNRQTLQQVLSASFGQPLTLEIQYADQVPGCPVAIQLRIDEARRLYVEQLLATDPLVVALCQQYGAALLPESLAVF